MKDKRSKMEQLKDKQKTYDETLNFLIDVLIILLAISFISSILAMFCF